MRGFLVIRNFILSLFVLISLFLQGQAYTFVSSVEVDGVCDAVVSYNILVDGFEVASGESSAIADSFRVVIAVDSSVICTGAIVRQELTGVYCETGEECPRVVSYAHLQDVCYCKDKAKADIGDTDSLILAKLCTLSGQLDSLLEVSADPYYDSLMHAKLCTLVEASTISIVRDVACACIGGVKHSGYLVTEYIDGVFEDRYFEDTTFANHAEGAFTSIGCAYACVPPCDCVDVPALGILPRMYRRRVNAGQWQVYAWQLQRIRNSLVGSGATIISEQSLYTSDAAGTLPLAAGRFNTGSNPATGTLTNHFINYNASSYLSTATEASVWHRHEVEFEYEGCRFVYSAVARVDVPGGFGWQFFEPNYVCGLPNDDGLDSRSLGEGHSVRGGIDVGYLLYYDSLFFVEGLSGVELASFYSKEDLILVASYMGAGVNTAKEAIAVILNKN